MKKLEEFLSIVEEEKTDYSKFDALVRAGLGNKAQIQRMHKILEKMGEENPQFSRADKQIVQNIFNKMVDIVTNNPNIFRQARKVVSEGEQENFVVSSDYKIGPSGKKIPRHRFRINKVDDLKKDQVTEATDPVIPPQNPPFVLVLKRTAVRLFPDGTKVALYHNTKLNKLFSVPFNAQYMGYNSQAPVIQAEETEYMEEQVMDTLHKIVDGKSAQRVKFASGETRKVDHFTASAITQVHNALNDDNKKKFADMVHKSPSHFMKAADFAFSKKK